MTLELTSPVWMANLLLAEAKAATHLHMATAANVTIVDRHMGSGKTTGIIAAFRPDQKYLVVVPLLSEIDRIIKGAHVPFFQPTDAASTEAENAQDYPENARCQTKRESLTALVQGGHNVVCSHALFSALGSIAQEGLLADYHVLIDEVLNVAEVKTDITQTKRTATGRDQDTGWRELYLDDGFISICPETGRISPTDKWRPLVDKLAGNLSQAMFHAAEAGRLYTDQAGMSNSIIMAELPPALLQGCRTIKVYTYMAEGSFMAAYMRRHGIEYRTEFDAVEDAAFRKRARQLVTVHPMARLKDYKLSYSAQAKEARKRNPSRDVARALYRTCQTAGELQGVDKDKIMVTCAKACWFAKGSDYLNKPGPFAQGSRLFDGAHWVPNTTRGTNDYQHCSHLIYLWDQNANVHVSRFLSVDDEQHRDLYAVSELLQWVWRSRVRKGEPITLFLPSARMRRLWSRWLDGEL
jgi:hypothetical protein